MGITLHAQDGNNPICNSYTSVTLTANVGLTIRSWGQLNNMALWAGGIVPDFSTIKIEGFCVDFTQTMCITTPTCVGETNCGYATTNTLGTTCGCNASQTVNIDYSQTTLLGNNYYKVTIKD
jgi:hypothetical protein